MKELFEAEQGVSGGGQFRIGLRAGQCWLYLSSPRVDCVPTRCYRGWHHAIQWLPGVLAWLAEVQTGKWVPAEYLALCEKPERGFKAMRHGYSWTTVSLLAAC